MRETDLYMPIKAFLSAAGYEVKAEVGACDLLAYKAEEEPLIVELKTGFSLTLFHQGIDRLKISDQVYLAVPKGRGRPWLKSRTNNMALCRRLGLGLMTVDLKNLCQVNPEKSVEVLVDAGPYAPRKNKPRQRALAKEFLARQGDPNLGGAAGKRVTAYKQDALRCVAYLEANGASKGASIVRDFGVGKATRIMADNHHGWFVKVNRGLYDLSDLGKKLATQDKDKINDLLANPG